MEPLVMALGGLAAYTYITERSVPAFFKRIKPYDEYIRERCYWQSIPYTVALGIIWRESKGKTGIRKLEKAGFYTYSPMHISYMAASHVGFTGSPLELLKPRTNVEYGINYLGYLYRRYVNMEDAISAYNAGAPTPANRDYVEEVLNMHVLFAQRPEAIAAV